MLKGHTLWTSIMNTLNSDGCFSDRMPLVHSETGSVVRVKDADEIQCLLLGDDGDVAGGEDGQKGPGSLADRFGDFFKKDVKADRPEGGGKGKARGEDSAGGNKKKSNQ